MIRFQKKNLFYKIYTWLPILALFISVFNEFDFNYLNIDYFLVFLAVLFNDTVVGLPLGISSMSYILICIFATYLRNITISPNLIKDWFYFLFIISLINSINFSVLFLFFSYELDITLFIVNNFFTFLFYIIFSIFFKRYLKSIDD